MTEMRKQNLINWMRSFHAEGAEQMLMMFLEAEETHPYVRSRNEEVEFEGHFKKVGFEYDRDFEDFDLYYYVQEETDRGAGFYEMDVTKFYIEGKTIRYQGRDDIWISFEEN